MRGREGGIEGEWESQQREQGRAIERKIVVVGPDEQPFPQHECWFRTLLPTLDRVMVMWNCFHSRSRSHQGKGLTSAAHSRVTVLLQSVKK